VTVNIFWLSNAPWAHSGYGNQTNLFWPRIQKLGHKVTLGSNYGLSGAPLNVETMGEQAQVYPQGFTAYGADVLAPYAKHAKADIAITLFDAWVFGNANVGDVRWVPWLPVDHDPAPPKVVTALQNAWRPIAYSRFGERKLQEAGLDPLYVPHGIDTKVFSPGDKKKAREALRFDEDADFVAVMVAANKGSPSRKSFNEVLIAWRSFVEKHPKAMLYMHTHTGREMAGEDLIAMLEALDMPAGRVIFCDPLWNVLGYPESYMANVYRAADVLINPAKGEGFGIPIVEAQACGTPVIVTDCTSMSELCFAGWKVSGQPTWTDQGSWQFTPYIDQIEDALDKAFELRRFDKLNKQAREGALAYDADRVNEEYWKPVLEQIESEIDDSGTLKPLAPEVEL